MIECWNCDKPVDCPSIVDHGRVFCSEECHDAAGEQWMDQHYLRFR